jgi:FtsP/CotA-like multicopper oxidase with cupredoxin domain
MDDRQPISSRRRAFLRGLLTTTSLVATGVALRPAWSQHAHGTATTRVRTAAPVATPPGPAFANPPVLSGTNGNYALNVAMVQTNLGPQVVNVRAFVDANNPAPTNAPLVAPTITLTGNGQPVQNVEIRLNNRLPILPDVGPVHFDTPHGFNTTNLHTHGLHVDPAQDNVYVELSPGSANLPPTCLTSPGGGPVVACQGTYTYRYAFGQTPTGITRLPAGTYWYHPHKHGSVGVQVASGMAGAFIVRGDLDAIPNMPPPTAESVMVAQLIEYTVPASPTTPAIVDPNVFYNGGATTNTQISINGQINPTVTMQFGQIQRWRLINATSEQFFYLSVAPNAGTTGTAPTLYAIAIDGVPLTNAPGPAGITVPFALGTPLYQVPAGIDPALAYAAAVMNEIAVLAPGQRIDLLVQAPASGAAGASYSVQAVPWLGASITQQSIVTINMGTTPISPAMTMPASSAFNANALIRPPLPARSAWPTSPTQNIQFGFIEGNTGAVVNNSTSPTPFGVAAAATPPPNAVPPPPPPAGATPFALPTSSTSAQLNLKLNAVDLWQVGSNPASTIGFGPHAFHIHINSFMMTQRNGVDISGAAIWRDTARIDQPAAPSTTAAVGAPPPTVAAGAPAPIQPVQFVSQQLDYVGNFVLHCHVLQHEDAGMMWSVNISS